MKATLEILYPKLYPDECVLLVPGAFGCKETRFSLAVEQEARIVAKLAAYQSLAPSEPRIVGFNPWHIDNRSGPSTTALHCMNLGGGAIPRVQARLEALGESIVNGSIAFPAKRGGSFQKDP